MTKQFNHIIQLIEEGVVQEPILMDNEEAAGNRFAQEVTNAKVQFRERTENESWDEYRKSFNEYYHGDDFPFDTNDLEIHWWILPVKAERPAANYRDNNHVGRGTIVIQPCRNIGPDQVERCAPEDAMFWGVYKKKEDGTLEWMIDMDTNALTAVMEEAGEAMSKRGDYTLSIHWSVSQLEERARENELYEVQEQDAELFDKLTADGSLAVPEVYRLYDRTKFPAALKRMISEHNPDNGISWDTVDDILHYECKIEKEEA